MTFTTSSRRAPRRRAPRGRHFYTYNKRGDNNGVYIIAEKGRCAFRSIYDCKAVLAITFKDAAAARAHARKAIDSGDRFGRKPTIMGSESR